MYQSKSMWYILLCIICASVLLLSSFFSPVVCQWKQNRSVKDGNIHSWPSSLVWYIMLTNEDIEERWSVTKGVSTPCAYSWPWVCSPYKNNKNNQLANPHWRRTRCPYNSPNRQHINRNKIAQKTIYQGSVNMVWGELDNEVFILSILWFNHINLTH